MNRRRPADFSVLMNQLDAPITFETLNERAS